MTKHDLMEFWYGLVNNKQRFLWVIRLDLVAGEGDGTILVELAEATRKILCTVGWVPQEEVLSHQTACGF